MKQLVSTTDSTALPLEQYPRPKRVVATFNIFVSGKKVEAVTTRGEKYTYLTLDGIDLWVPGRLATDSRWKVVEQKEVANAQS